MASFEVLFKPSVGKDLRPLPQPMVARIMERIEVLKENPFPRQLVKMTGAEQLYRLRVGNGGVALSV